MIKVVFLMGNHPRHAYVARQLDSAGVLCGLVIERREEFIPPMVDLGSKDLEQLYVEHFDGRASSEKKFFGSFLLPNVPLLEVSKAELNNRSTCNFINKLTPDVVMSYGVHKLSEETLSEINATHKWNIHGGLSPWYRGVATHFWPSYFLQPQFTGMTIHQLTQDIDGGGIIHQSLAPLIKNDGLHDLACRAVIELCKDFSRLFNVMERGLLRAPELQISSGRIWREIDWQPSHLRVIYQLYKNSVVNYYLNNEFIKVEPKVVRQF